MDTGITLSRGESNDGRVKLVLDVPVVYSVEYEVLNENGDKQALPDLNNGLAKPYTYSSALLRRSASRTEPGVWTFAFEIADDAAIGDWKLKAYVKVAKESTEQSFDLDFAVTATKTIVAATAKSNIGMYCTVADLRADGVTEEMASDARLTEICKLAAKYIEEFTGRFFEARRLQLWQDGNATRTLHVPHPIIEVQELAIVNRHFAKIVSGDMFVIDRENYVVANRWLSHRDDFGRLAFHADAKGAAYPGKDDRDNPTISFVVPDEVVRRYGARRPWNAYGLGSWGQVWGPHGALYFPAGRQNVRVTGTFGYVDEDPNTGQLATPILVKRAAMLLALRNLKSLTECERQNDLNKNRVTSESTDGHSYSLEQRWLKGGFTGDWEIDGILAQYRRPNAIATA